MESENEISTYLGQKGYTIYKNALEFDETNPDYVKALDSASYHVQNLSISAWVKTTNAQGSIIHLRSSSGDYSWRTWRLGINGGKAFVQVNDGGSTAVTHHSQNTVNDGEWHHVVGVINGDEKKLMIYIDGNLSGTYTSYTNPIDYTSVDEIYIGAFDATNVPFNGKIDEVRIYNKALSSSEVSTLYAGDL